MIEKEKPNRLKSWHVVALSAIILSILVFAASLGILIGLPAMVEKNIREVSLFLEGTLIFLRQSNVVSFRHRVCPEEVISSTSG